ncbi:MAG TPA: serine hydrolase [Vicinamibacteria bacterium]|nr:serine hydrolase [Vicinamibacteria bacterium]
MRLLESLVLSSLLVASGTVGRAAEKPSPGLPRSSPEEQGVASSSLLAFVEAADEQIDAMHSFMLVRHGHVVAEGWWTPYDRSTRHSLYSLTKSFTSTAVGMAVAEGRLKTEDLVLPYFADEAPAEPSDNLKAMRVRDLLTMSTGQHKEAPFGPDESWTRSFLAQPVEHKPGTFFLYNTPASHMLSAIVQKAVGAPLAEYLQPRLFEPLGIESPVWSKSPQGLSIGGFGMSIRTEDIARFGQLYLQKGVWQGKRLLPEAWVATATARQMSNGSKPESDWEQGYGYQFWRSRHGAFRGDGAFGQYCLVLPEQDAVVVITSGVKDMQAVLNLVWDRLLPALQPKALAADAAGRQKLERKLAGLTLKPVEGVASSSGAPSGVGRKYLFPANDQKLESLALEGGPADAVTLVARFAGAEQRIACGRGAWRKGRLAFGALPEQPVAASGAWSAEGIYTAKVWFYETPFAVTLSLRFSGNDLVVDSEYNVAFGPTKQPQLVGHAE